MADNNDDTYVNIRLWTSASQKKVIKLPINPNVSTVADLRNVIAASGHAKTPSDIYMWTEHPCTTHKYSNASILDQYLELPFLDMLVAQLATNLRISPDSRFVTEDSKVSMTLLSNVLQTFYNKTIPPSRSHKKKSLINVNDDDSIRQFMLECFTAITAVPNQTNLRRIGTRYILNTTDSEVIPDVPNISPFSPSNTKYLSSTININSASNNRVHAASSPYEYELVSDAMLGSEFIEFTTSKHVKDKEIHPFYFHEVHVNDTHHTNSHRHHHHHHQHHPTIQVLSARAFSMSVPAIPSPFAPDFLYEIFTRLSQGPIFYHLVNKDDSMHDRYKLDTRYSDVVTRSIARRWVNATPPNIQKPALHLHIPLLDKSIDSMAIVTIDRNFRQHLQLRFAVLGPMRAISEDAISKALEKVRISCTDPVNEILRSLDAPIRMHTIHVDHDQKYPSLSHASNHMKWLETHYIVSSSKHPRIMRMDILPHISGNMYIYRHVSGFKDPKVINKMAEILMYTGASQKHARDLMVEWFGISLDYADSLLNMVASTGKTMSTNTIMLHAPVITIQKTAHVRGAYISPYALKNIVSTLFGK